MRRSTVLGRTAILSATAALAALAGCERAEDNAASVETSYQEPEGDTGQGDFAFDASADGEKGEVLRKLETLYKGAPSTAFITDEARLAEARAWVEANRPDADERMKEVEARYLAIMSEFFEGADLTLAKARDLMSMETLDVWALDANRDGEVSDDELESANFLMSMDPTEHPFLQAQFDTDGDGQISDQERIAADQKMMDSSMSMFASLGNDAALRVADADGDGVVSPEERDASLRQMASSGNGFGVSADGDGDGVVSDEEWAAATEQMKAMVDANSGMTEDQVYAQMFAGAFFEKFETVTVDLSLDRSGTAAEMPAFPDYQSFDTDGEPGLSPAEQEAWRKANQAYAEEMKSWNERAMRQFRLARFNAYEAIVDTDGDGIASDAEWAAAQIDFDNQRDTSLFRWFYDTDQNGEVGPAEADAFMRWFEQGHMRADINLDGVLDQADVRRFADLFVAQQ